MMRRPLIIAYFFVIASLFYIVSGGDYRHIMSDFDFYFNRLTYIQRSNISITDWFSSLPINEVNDMGLERVSDWIPTPFYSLLILGPLCLHNSDILFAIQGVFIATLTSLLIFKVLNKVYMQFGTRFSNICLIIGIINPAFLKDALSCGPTSVCNLFLLLSLNHWNKSILASLFLACAAMTRSSYFIYWVAIVISIIIVDRKHLSNFIKTSSLSLVIYIIFYSLFYSTYPGSGYSYVFLSGFRGAGTIDEFFLSILSPQFGVESFEDIMNLNLSINQFFSIFLNNFKAIYGVFALWCFKILSSLGFMSYTFFTDSRELWVQRLSNLLYFIFVMGPGFVFSVTSLILFRHKNSKFWVDREKLLVAYACVFLVTHSFIMGNPRYATSISWIISTFFARYILLLNQNTNSNPDEFLHQHNKR